MYRNWLIVAYVAVVALAACTGAPNASSTATPTVCPAVGTLIAPPPLIYPPNGATGVADGNFNVILGYAYGSVTLTGANTNSATAASPVPAPLPLPSSPVTPSPSSTPVAYAVPALMAATTYTVVGTLTPVAGCPSFSNTFGTFTTQ